MIDKLIRRGFIVKIECIKKCYAFKRLYSPGETREFDGDVKDIPVYFKLKGKASIKKVEKKGPVTFKALQDEEMKDKKGKSFVNAEDILS